jgi:hypothetical protein
MLPARRQQLTAHKSLAGRQLPSHLAQHMGLPSSSSSSSHSRSRTCGSWPLPPCQQSWSATLQNHPQQQQQGRQRLCLLLVSTALALLHRHPLLHQRQQQQQQPCLCHQGLGLLRMLLQPRQWPQEQEQLHQVLLAHPLRSALQPAGSTAAAALQSLVTLQALLLLLLLAHLPAQRVALQVPLLRALPPPLLWCQEQWGQASLLPSPQWW